ncbi:hypothetical protein QOT17_019505 [Balamuthia mandrillaris]
MASTTSLFAVLFVVLAGLIALSAGQDCASYSYKSGCYSCTSWSSCKFCDSSSTCASTSDISSCSSGWDYSTTDCYSNDVDKAVKIGTTVIIVIVVVSLVVVVGIPLLIVVIVCCVVSKKRKSKTHYHAYNPVNTGAPPVVMYGGVPDVYSPPATGQFVPGPVASAPPSHGTEYIPQQAPPYYQA